MLLEEPTEVMVPEMVKVQSFVLSPYMANELPVLRSGVEMIMDCAFLGSSYESRTLPSASVRHMTVPEEMVLLWAYETTFCPELEAGVSTIPSAPQAHTMPPSTMMLPSESSAALSPLVGPDTYSSPPEMSMLPLESRPSPLASTHMVPPEIMMWQLLLGLPGRFVVPSAPFMPSSEDVTDMSPPDISTLAASMPS